MTQSRRQRSSHRWLVALLLSLAIALLPLFSWSAGETSLPASQYASTITAPFNQPSYYPITTDSPGPFFRPMGEWIGRLILPDEAEYQQFAQATQETDWAWLEVETAPPGQQALVGQTVRLAWQPQPLVQAYVKKASRDVQFAPEIQQTWEGGVIHPLRLNGRSQVGPLQSVAGAHPYDDVTVQLQGQVTVDPTTMPATLRVAREPMQESGRFAALVKLIEPVPPDDPADLPEQCPGAPPCPSDRFRVRHYNPASRAFDGPATIIRIPQQPADWIGVYNMSVRELAQSPAGEAGWYIYGANDATGLFTVQSMLPRSLVQLTPQRVVLGLQPGLRYVTQGNWQDAANRYGQIDTVLVDGTAQTPDAAIAAWKLGDRLLAMHLYGGRGGTQPRSEQNVLGTYAGHFSFGMGQVIPDPFTQEPILHYDYLQVYGNGVDGTLSGPNTWANYAGNLRRGVIGTRPLSDVLVKLAPLTAEYQFGDTSLSFYNELLRELSLIGARYRIGDGSGSATITSATSCVQDSSQALFLTLWRFRDKIEANPEWVAWMKAHPDAPTTQNFAELVALSRDLAQQLTPLGVVRWDWQQNAEVLTGMRPDDAFISIDDFQPKNLLTGLISWRTAMPRQAHDELALLFLRHGAALWFLRPNQIGGVDPGLAPLEPTLLLGAWKLPGTETPLLSYLVIRTFGGVTLPTPGDWLTALLLLLGFGAIALPLGFARNFLHWQPVALPWYRQLLWLLRLLLVPALLQEYVFRVLLNYYPTRYIPPLNWWGMALLALGLFMGFQWGYGQLRRSRRAVLHHPLFLSLITLLGLTNTLAYWLTGSLWTITAIHWVVMAVWWLLLGRRSRFQPQSAADGPEAAIGGSVI